MNNYDDWKAGNYGTERDEELYTEEQILIEQIEILERKLDNQVKNILRLQGQLKRLSEFETTFSTFGKLTFEEQQEKKQILSIYETT
jgi:hypothetical protein